MPYVTPHELPDSMIAAASRSGARHDSAGPSEGHDVSAGFGTRPAKDARSGGRSLTVLGWLRGRGVDLGNTRARARAAVEVLAGLICPLLHVRRNADGTGGARYHRRVAPETTRLAIARRGHPPADRVWAQGEKGAATMIRVISVALSLAVLAPGNHPALSQPLTTLYSGDELLPSCRLAIRAERPSGADLVKATYCLGVVATLIAIGPMLESDYRFCFPKGGNTEQAVQVVVALLEMKPAVLQLDFRVLAVNAMKESWPCKP